MQKKQGVVIFSTAYLPLLGGAELAIKEITDHISDCDFFLITARMNSAFPRRERIGNVDVYRIGAGIPIFDKIISPFVGAFLARRLIKKNDILCFWSMMVTFTSGAPFVLKLFGLHKNIPLLLTLQEGDSSEHIRRSRFGLVGLSWRLALRWADRVQVISNYLGSMARDFGYQGEISVIPNGANLEKIKNQKSKIKTTNQNSKIVITTSRLVKKNGIDILIDAIAKAREQIPDIQCWILGDGPEKEILKLQARSYKLEAHVNFFGTIPYEKISDYLAQADVFVRPSRSEGLGSAFLDAMAAGLPIIGTPVGGIPDFLKDGETGLFARPDDADDLAEKIEHLLNDGALRQRLVENGKKLVEEHYDWHGIADRMYALFAKKNTLRVLIATGIYPPDIGGPATYSHTIADELSARGIKVAIVTYGDRITNNQDTITKQIPNSKFQIHRISRKLPKGIRHLFYFLSVLWNGMRADVVFAQQPVSEGVPAMLAATILRKKFVLKVVGDYAWEQGVQRFGVTDLLDDFLKKKYRFRVQALRKLESWTAKRADCVITVSHYLAGVVAQWGVPQKRIVVIANAVEIPASLPIKEEARRMVGIAENEKIILSVGRLVPWKGFGALIESMTNVFANEPIIKLVIIGSGPEQLKLESRIMNDKLGDRIHLIGSLSHAEVLQYLRAADVFVLNTAYEGFSHLLIEAMAVGTPIVTTSAGGNREIVKNEENALVVNYNHQQEIAKAITRILRESVLRQTLSENGRRTAAQFTKKRMVGETLSNIL